MYVIDEHDRVIELRDLPQSSVGAPCPVVLSDGHQLLLAYYLQDAPSEWDGTDAASPGEPVAIIRFTRSRAFMMGPPNDEAFAGHPLAKRGLQPYGSFEVLKSSWTRQLERMNAVHPAHRPEHFADYRHFVFTFHDDTFECIATGYTIEVATGSTAELIAHAARGSSKESMS